MYNKRFPLDIDLVLELVQVDNGVLLLFLLLLDDVLQSMNPLISLQPTHKMLLFVAEAWKLNHMYN